MEPLEKLDEIFEPDSDEECDLRPIDSDDSDDEFSQDLMQRLQRYDRQRTGQRPGGTRAPPPPVEDEFERAVNAELSASMAAHCRRLAPHIVSDLALPAPTAEAGDQGSSTGDASRSDNTTASAAAAAGAGTAPANGAATAAGEKKDQEKKPEQEYYDDVYFDSDDDSDPDDAPSAPAEGSATAGDDAEMVSDSAPADGRSGGAPVADPSSKRSERRRRRRRPVLTNDQLLYDPDMDERDQQWVDRQRRKYQPAAAPGTSGSGNLKSQPMKLPHSDAVLNCPACMTMLCLDCQRHELYSNQYRAMFVFNCDVDSTQALRYRLKEPPARRRGRGRRGGAAGEPEFRQSPAADAQELFNPVKCTSCKTEVAVYDSDEVYHFFNVIASHS